ncbi:DUF2971 domain-containing protein [Enterobacter hormaechei]|uniref:DUF2971 domain-containing protein n=1 Tax=Enterobacter hormaechei TaxID=158836 RepID=UPI0022386F74|nr:DUF2971 domain-containing protein [Enterobacter hormaechei subsp. xiangfangensis]MCW6041848.1 DUF2971 domain-containing protein [Enterobacter hormaechei subsp. xiangfangensis]MCW6046583.1 DUF2971 domain-containing protein [Enterobacter hormaechei subsp. xiangfangensis]
MAGILALTEIGLLSIPDCDGVDFCEEISVPNEIILPDSLVDNGFSLESHVFRYRSDRDFYVEENGQSICKNLIVEEMSKFRLWHSAVGALNDPFEIYARRNLQEFQQMSEKQKLNLWVKVGTRLGYHALMALSTKEILKGYEIDKERLEKTVYEATRDDSSFDSFITEIRETLGIACFTSICDSRLMWGYYCNGLAGVCLIYNRRLLASQRVELNLVKYIDGPFELNILDFIYNYKDDVRAKTLSQIVKTKHLEWDHEVESRSVVELRGDEIGLGRLIEMKCSCVEGVIIGSKVRAEVRKEIEWLGDTLGFKVFQASVDYQLFGVKIS